MERFNRSSSGKKSKKNEIYQVLKKPQNDITNKNIGSYKHREAPNLSSQVQVVPDSLVAFSQMPKYRSVRKTADLKEKASSHFFPTPQSSVQILLPAEGRVLSNKPSSPIGGRNFIFSYIKKLSRKVKNFQRNQEEFIPKSNSDKELEKIGNSDSSSDEYFNLKKRSSKVKMYEPGNVIPERVIEIILRELKTLKKLAPSLTLLITTMSDTMSHYKNCSKCRNKTSSAFPWILNRLQKLIKFIITKRNETYTWPDDYSYLRLVSQESPINEPEEKNYSEFYNLTSPSEEELVQFGQLEKVDAFAVSEGHPGVQILLQVKPVLKKKRYFCKIGWAYRENLLLKFSTVLLEEASDIPLFVVLRPSSQPKLVWNEKRALSSPKEVFHLFPLRFESPLQIPESILLTLDPGNKISLNQKTKLEAYPKKLASLRQQNRKKEPKVIRRSGGPKFKSNEKKSVSLNHALIDASELVLSYVNKAEDNMQIQKTQELESDFRDLKDLLVDVQKNQAELSKVLLKKGIFSRPIIKFTAPEMLQEEDWAVNKVAELKLHKARTSSIEALQKTVGDLKRKCNLKNRVIITLLKGFQSNIPKEWCEEILNSMFKESSEEDLDSEKVSEFIRQTAFFLMNGEQASRPLLPITKVEEQPSKEEPNMKGIMGTDIQDNLNILSDLDDKLTKIMDDTLLPLASGVSVSTRTFAYPASVSENLNSSVKKLEYQVSTLNVENEKLWHEILELRDTLKNSVKELGERTSERTTRRESDKPLTLTAKSFPKTVSVTIQITSDKNGRLAKDSGILKVIKVGEAASKSSTSGSLKDCSPLKNKGEDFFFKENSDESIVNKKLNVLATGSKLQSKPENRRSKSDFRSLDDFCGTPPPVSRHRQDEDKLKALLRERAFGRASNSRVEQVMATTNPHYSEQGLWKNIQPVPSLHVVAEATSGYHAGPSQKRLETEDFLQSPSLMELTEGRNEGILLSVSKERELHPIPEDDNLDPRSSGSINEAIQRLRAKVRSIHKDVTVLKSKNDRIDKVLNRLVDGIKSNYESFEEIQETLFPDNIKK